MIELAESIPAWIAIPVALLLIAGSLITLIGTLGLVRLPHFYQRIHGPAISITFGTSCFVMASILYFSGLGLRPVLHELLLSLFVLLTAPVSAMLLMRAAVYRDLRNTHKKTEHDNTNTNQPPSV